MFIQGLVGPNKSIFLRVFQNFWQYSFFPRRLRQGLSKKFLGIEMQHSLYFFFLFWKNEWSHLGLVPFKCLLLKDITFDWKKSFFSIKVKVRIVQLYLVKYVQHRLLCIFVFCIAYSWKESKTYLNSKNTNASQ